MRCSLQPHRPTPQHLRPSGAASRTPENQGTANTVPRHSHVPSPGHPAYTSMTLTCSTMSAPQNVSITTVPVHCHQRPQHSSHHLDTDLQHDVCALLIIQPANEGNEGRVGVDWQAQLLLQCHLAGALACFEICDVEVLGQVLVRRRVPVPGQTAQTPSQSQQCV